MSLPTTPTPDSAPAVSMGSGQEYTTDNALHRALCGLTVVDLADATGRMARAAAMADSFNRNTMVGTVRSTLLSLLDRIDRKMLPPHEKPVDVKG